MQKQSESNFSSATLHLMAMAFMLCSHLSTTVLQDNSWLAIIGKLSLPIVAYIATEFYFYTENFEKYAIRLLILAAVSEIPFNLMYSCTIIYPFQQNVVWALLVGICLIHFNETAKKAGKQWFTAVIAAISIVVALFFGSEVISDYYGTAIITVMAFYLLRGDRWWCLPLQAAALYYINVILLGGSCYEFSFYGTSFSVDRQLFALLALVPIWLCKGRKNSISEQFRQFCGAFYPVHMAVLAAVSISG